MPAVVSGRRGRPQDLGAQPSILPWMFQWMGTRAGNLPHCAAR